MKSILPKISQTAQTAPLLALCLLLSLSSCASTPLEIVVTETETVTITKEIMVPVPASLTAQVEIPILPDQVDTLQLGAVYKATVIRLMIANMKLEQISKLK